MPEPTFTGEFEPYPGEASTGSTGVRVAQRRGEAACLTRAAEGDSDAWSDLVDSLQPSVWAAAGAHGLPKAGAAHVCELVWLRLAQRLDDPPQPLRPWMLGIVEAEASRWQRARRNDGAERHLDDVPRQTINTSD